MKLTVKTVMVVMALMLASGAGFAGGFDLQNVTVGDVKVREGLSASIVPEPALPEPIKSVNRIDQDRLDYALTLNQFALDCQSMVYTESVYGTPKQAALAKAKAEELQGKRDKILVSMNDSRADRLAAVLKQLDSNSLLAQKIYIDIATAALKELRSVIIKDIPKEFRGRQIQCAQLEEETAELVNVRNRIIAEMRAGQ